LTDNVEIIIKDKLPKNVDIAKIVDLLRKNIPDAFLRFLKNIHIGQYPILKKRNISALNHNFAIYIDNEQKNEKDIIDDIIHELAHCVEEKYSQLLYEDQFIVNEFLGKRNRLHDLLAAEEYELNYFDFLNLEYDKEFDDFLFKDVGYEKIENIAPTLFVRPYAATSLREYFATGFEEYYLKGPEQLKKISLQLYKKIRNFEKLNDFKGE
tara:strand:- start:451 stop:1080 length:630 start_codon:yes stop_codon:yes gene_type:complete